MGEYKVDLNFSEITIDGHKCIQELPRIYKVTDDYRVNEEDWFNNEENKNLLATALYNEDEDKHKVLYVCEDTLDCRVTVLKLMPKGAECISMMCLYTGLYENVLFTIL